MTKDGSGMKSAYELAMERLKQREGVHAPLSADRKKAIHEVESQTQARVAEVEIMMDGQIAAARAAGDEAKLRELQEQRVHELRKLRERGEAEKEEIRRSGKDNR